MQIITDQKEIDLFIKEKALNEFKMAKALCDLFDKKDFALQEQLQFVANSAINLLCSLSYIFLKNPTNYKNSLDMTASVYLNESKLKVFSDPQKKEEEQKSLIKSTDSTMKIVETAGSILEKLKYKKSNIETQKIGEIIRIFAGVCEKIVENSNAKNEVMNLYFLTDKDTVQIDVLTKKTKNPKEDPLTFDTIFYNLTAYRGSDYGIKAFSKLARSRCDGKNGNPQANWKGRYIDKDLVKLLVFEPGEPVATGNTFYLPLMPGDVVREIDAILGLPQGASISGTTSDTLWALELLTGLFFLEGEFKGDNGVRQKSPPINKGDPNLLLVALAAIVSGYHHTALEVGLPMSINGYINYQPGLYTSFQDKYMKDPKNGGEEIASILQKFEDAPENRLMMITQDFNNETFGHKRAYVFNKDNKEEKETFRKAVTMDYAGYLKWFELSKSNRRAEFEHQFRHVTRWTGGAD